MKNAKRYSSMRPTGRRIVNVYCGHVNWLGEVIFGCHAPPSELGFVEFSYKIGGLFSTVTLCQDCLKVEVTK
jgi:hypothetical protein